MSKKILQCYLTRCVILFLVPLAFSSTAAAAEKIGYNHDIRPILSDNCFYCHGPDKNKRKGKFRLDVREDAVAKKAIVPNKPEESELIKRIFETNQDDLMPPPDSHKKLTPKQKELLRRWIATGAKYEAHWSYVPPIKPAIAKNKSAIDFLVKERLRQVGLKPSSQADRRTLARRLYFDLIGLPPKPEEVEKFARDKSTEAYSKLVDSLLALPQFGERMAIGWLDVVRFADTMGYHADNAQNVFPYRDYVIKSFNENKPFDQFTREQLAGDLLPNSTLEQKVGSAFNRLILSTEEGGAQAKDYEARMLTDRVRAVSSVWLGQTFGCANCHDHKFDPIKQRDFYSLGAFFADIKEPIIGRREEGILVPDKKQAAELARLSNEVTPVEKDYDAPHPELAEAFSKWEKVQTAAGVEDKLWKNLIPSKAKSAGGAKLKTQSDKSILASGKKTDKDTYTLSFTNALKEIVGLRVEALTHDSLPGKGPGRADNGNFVLTELVAKIHRANQKPKVISFSAARADFEQATFPAISVIDGETKTGGWAVVPEVGKSHLLILELSKLLVLQPGETLTLELYQNFDGHTLGHFRIGVTASIEATRKPLLPLPKEVTDILAVAAEKRDQKQKDKLFAYFKGIASEMDALRNRLAAVRKAKADYEATVPRCIVSISSEEKRTVRILPRGNFMIETGEIMKPTLPLYLTAAAKKEERPLNRLDLANWLVSRDNPLTARVVMNRLWKQFFGIGLSKVVDDFGSQGEPPPNQALLDWLACEFMDSGWDMKHMVRLIVNSETYKQESSPTKKLRTRDPSNRELAAQSRWRLEAELVRDNALTISGLLVPKIGGPSVKPYQPEGYWENLNFPARTYDASKGEDQYRRGLYTWWQRSYMHPSMLAFDAPTREECAAERNRSNIPQQALVLLNDPSYVEASRVFAVRILKEGGSDTKSRITWAWRQTLSRAPRADELKTIQALLKKHLLEYRGNKAAAESLLKIGQTPLPKNVDQSELAAWTNIARVILNLHETITRS